MLKGIRVRRFGSSYVMEFTTIGVEPFNTLKRALETVSKLPAYVEKRGDEILVKLPVVEGGRVCVQTGGEMTSVWTSDGRYFITIPKSIGREGNYSMEVNGNVAVLKRGIVIRRSELDFRPASEI